MRGKLLIAVSCTLLLCCSCSRPANGISVEAHGYGSKTPIRRLYIESEGAPQVAERFKKVLAIAFADHGLEMEPDKKKAEGVIKIRAEEKTGPQPIYAEILSVKLLTRDGKARDIDTCQYTTEQRILSPDKWSYNNRVYLANRLRQKSPELKSFFIGPLKDDKNSVLSEGIKADFLNESFTLSSDRSQADVILEDARPHAVEYSLEALQQIVFVDATVDAWNGYSYKANITRTLYKSSAEPESETPEGCFLSHYTRNYSADPMWETASQLAESLSRHK